jgi:uncharacterized protein (DUF362 family)
MVKVVISKGNAYTATLKALELTDFKQLVKGKKKIVIKPNLVVPVHSSKGITTDVNVVKAILDFLPDYKKVVIADGSSKVDETFKLNGYNRLAKEYGIPLLNLNEDEMVNVTVTNPFVFREIKIAKTVLDSDFLISVAKLKTHSLTGITGSMKNLIGICPKSQKLKLHAFLPYSLLDLFSIILPDFGIIDGIVANEIDENIPHPVKMGIVLAGKDCVALDAVASKIMGMCPEEISHVWNAHKMGLGTADLTQIEIVGEAINNLKRNFRIKRFNLRSYNQKIFTSILIKLKLFDLVYPYIEKTLTKNLLVKIVKSFF